MARKKLSHLFLGTEEESPPVTEGAPPPPSEPKSGESGGLLSRQRLITAGVVALGLAAAFLGGFLLGDDSGEVSSLEDQVAKAEDELAGAENQVSIYSGEAEELEESTESLEGKLHAERSLNGRTTVPQNTEYETDFDWETAGTVGYLTMKPIDLTQSGSKWILTIEAKNEGNEPESPFCGDGGAALEDSAERTYSGETVIGSGSDSCEELQPGLTGTFKSEFTLPEDANPAIALIYGDYEQEDEAKA
jgi:hypothetical protein